MDLMKNQIETTQETEDFVYVTQMYMMSILPMALRAVVELDLLEIIAREGKGAQLSPSVLASHLPTSNPNAPNMIDRALRLLSSYSLLNCSIVTGDDGKVERLFSLAPASKFLVRNKDGVSLAPFFIYCTSKPNLLSWLHLKDAILEGGIPFIKAHGTHLFGHPSINPDLIECQTFLNKSMFSATTMVMKEILHIYNGFENLKHVVDVGGGLGTSISIITSKYPTIEGINYDLPHVIANAPLHPGVKHIGGDMFESVPKGDSIFLKWVLHDWNDEQCAKILENCYEALPDQGKVILFEVLLTDPTRQDAIAKNVHLLDVMMMGFHGGKERTEQELEALFKGAGFSRIIKICRVYESWVIECCKNN
ncbi:hypothetical protein GIB67_015186 [Kingdonia uniflora]|uniref:Uncharacterized protein n=1 Tax=Kingdonia uniflora TaxID=39325 RepID=A0A7J7LJJ4_9MAGN|nr:hypothetical protein GIB67_015186 [Kingdonia uniflora]